MPSLYKINDKTNNGYELVKDDNETLRLCQEDDFDPGVLVGIDMAFVARDLYYLYLLQQASKIDSVLIVRIYL